ncbi:50S ribosomal protein L10 [Candidatus Woesebacteria bacterium]|nr:50S ribosomal protein L10 [Candidatus Woesebacteria bacterium]
MPNKYNLEQVELLKKKVAEAKSIAVVEYSGTTVNDQVKLRSALRQVGGEFRVVKNTLVDKVINNSTLMDSLHGMNGLVFSFADEVSALKELFKFRKETEKLTIKQGYMDGKVLSAAEVETLSKLPGKQELIASLISRINGPAYALVNVLQASQRGLVYALNALAQKKSGETA